MTAGRGEDAVAGKGGADAARHCRLFTHRVVTSWAVRLTLVARPGRATDIPTAWIIQYLATWIIQVNPVMLRRVASPVGYQSFCLVGAALNVVGERWALLVVRDLLLGPRRYSDLLAGLGGIGTDILAARLRALQDHGIGDRPAKGAAGGTSSPTPAKRSARC